jgi:acetyl-CoA carboxylase biotin carboxyl carrier protein
VSVDELERLTASSVPDLQRVVEVTRELVDLAGDAQLTKLSVHTGGVSWEIEGGVVAMPVLTTATAVPSTAVPSAAGPEPTPVLLAPAVGVFTRAADLQVGDPVSAGQPLGHVEAMRMRTDIVADRDGVLAEIHATDGEIVEYGQPLFTVTPG